MDIQSMTLGPVTLPSLKVYTTLGLLGATSSLYSLAIWAEAQDPITFRHSQLRQSNFTHFTLPDGGSELESSPLVAQDQNLTLPHSVGDGLTWTTHQPYSLWVLLNLVVCLFILLTHFLQRTIFGKLRSSERSNIKDQLRSLVFYKMVFLFGVVTVEEIEEGVGWVIFLSFIVFLQLTTQLSKERHKYLVLMNSWTRRTQIQRNRILGLLLFICLSSIGLCLGVCAWYGSSRFKSTPVDDQTQRSQYEFQYNLGLQSAVFMVSEIGLLSVQTLHALFLCCLEDWKEKHHRRRGHVSSQGERSQGETTAHSISFFIELTILLLDLVHHVHMLVSCNLFLSMTSLILSLQMRIRARQIHGILKKRHSFTWLSQHIQKYPDFCPKKDESKDKENCAICWDMISSQKSKILPCNHIFHGHCLKKWLLISMNCPTCRFSLPSQVDEEEKGERGGRNRRSRRVPYEPPADGFWGFLETGQTLLDLFGGWDPQGDEVAVPPSAPPSVSLFGNFESSQVNLEQPLLVPLEK